MACPSLTQAREPVIAAAWENPEYVGPGVEWNPRKAHERRVRRCLRSLLRTAQDLPIPGFSYAWRPDDGDGVLLAVFDKANRRLVGGIDHKNVYVVPEYRGRGIGPEILVAAFATGVMHPDSMNEGGNVLSHAGRGNRVKAHRLAVERALAAGDEVPDAVLADYPDLSGTALAA